MVSTGKADALLWGRPPANHPLRFTAAYLEPRYAIVSDRDQLRDATTLSAEDLVDRAFLGWADALVDWLHPLELRDVWEDRPRTIDTNLDDPTAMFDVISTTGAVWTATAASLRLYPPGHTVPIPLDAPPIAGGVSVAEGETRPHVTALEEIVRVAAGSLQRLVPESVPTAAG